MRPVVKRTLRWVLSLFEILVAIAAIVGGGALVYDPTGVTLGLSTSILRGFHTFLVPGLMLLGLGILLFICAVWTAKRGARGLVAAQVAGVLLIVWIAFQTALVVPVSYLQVIVALLGGFIFIVAHELYGEEPHRPVLP